MESQKEVYLSLHWCVAPNVQVG